MITGKVNIYAILSLGIHEDWTRLIDLYRMFTILCMSQKKNLWIVYDFRLEKDDGSMTSFLSKCFAISQFCSSLHITSICKCSDLQVNKNFVNVNVMLKLQVRKDHCVS